MTPSVKLAGLCCVAVTLGGSLANARQVQAPAAPARPAAVPVPADGAQGIGEIDYSSILPIDFGIPNVNGPTDRFGMPLMGPFLKGPQMSLIPDAAPENPTPTASRRTPTKRSAAGVKGRSAQGKDARRSTNRSSRGTSAAAPRYDIPHGSLEWTPGRPMISTSPANPYGYGYGNSGYGTEVFGDFWKGWPMVW